MGFIDLNNVSRKYRETLALNNINLSFNLNEFVAIVGHSGSGKTTLLEIIGQQETYDGTLLVDGRKLNKTTKRIVLSNLFAYIYQNFHLVDYFNVRQNISLPLAGQKINQKDLDEICESLNIKDKLDHYPNQLSGGEQQRAAIARCLIRKPKVILADEPTGCLDSKTSTEIMNLLKQNAEDKLVIFATHNEELARQYATRIIRLENGQVISDEVLSENRQIERAPINTKLSNLSPTKAFKETLLSYKKRKKGIIAVAIIFAICLSGILSIFGLSEGIDTYISYLNSTRLDAKYISLSYYENGEAKAANDDILLSLSNQNISYFSHTNFNFLFNNFLYDALYQEERLDFVYTYAFIDFALLSSHQLEMLGLSTPPATNTVLINSVFADNLKQTTSISIEYADYVLSEYLGLDETFKIAGIIDEGSLYNEAKIYLDIKYIREVLDTKFITYFFEEQKDLDIPLYLVILSNFETAYKYLDEREDIYNIYEAYSTTDNNFYLLDTSSLILRVAFSSLISAFRAVLTMSLILVLICSFNLLNLAVIYIIKNRMMELNLRKSFGAANRDIFLVAFSEAGLITFSGMGVSLVLALVAHFLLYSYSSTLFNQSWSFDLYKISWSGILTSIFICLISSFLAASKPVRHINKESIGGVLKDE